MNGLAQRASTQINGQQRVLVSALVFVAIVCVNIGQTVVFAILPPLGREVGLVEWQIGSIITCSSLMFAISSPRWGKLSDRWGRKPVIIVGLIGYTLGTIMFASIFWLAMQGRITGWTLYGWLVFARVLQALIMSATSPAAAAYMADITDARQRTAAMGLISSGHSIGTIVGPAVAYFAFISLLAPMYMVAGATLIAACLVVLWLPRAPVTWTRDSTTASAGLWDKRVFPFIAVGVTMYTGFSIVQQTLGYYFQDKLQLTAIQTAQQVGYAMMGTAVAALCSQVLVVQGFRWRPVNLMRLGFMLMACGFLGLALAESALTLSACMVVVGAGMGMSGPGFSSSATLSVSAQEQGAVAGLVAACPAMGFVTGPLVGAGLYHLDPHFPYYAATLMFLPLIAFVWVNRRVAAH